VSYNSSGISYQKIEPPKMAQAFTGQRSSPGPNTLTKAMGKAWEKLGTLPAGESQGFLDIPLFNPTPAEVEKAELR
jgi:hypothetical protein